MDEQLRVPEEHSGERSYRYSDLPEVRLEDFEQKDLEDFLPVFYRFMVEVHQSDPNGKTIVDGLEVPTIEARLFWHLFEGHKITLTRRGKDIVGFMIYEIPYPGLMLVRAMYADRRGAGSIKMYVDAVGHDTRKIFFQTRVANPPEQLLKATYGKRVVIHEGPELITWEMELEHGNNR